MRSERILGVLGMSFSEWKEYKLEDVTINYNSKRVPLSSKERELRQGKYPYYGAQGVIDFIDKFILEGQYLLVAEDGANLETRNEDIARLTKNQEQFWVNNHAHILRSNENSDIRYIKYFLNKSDLSGYITGSAQPKLNKANLNSIRMVLPPFEEQKAIAHILSTLDEKIEVNNQINKTLENMAQAYFDDMFPNVAAGDTTIGEYITPKRGKNLLSKDAISGEVPVIAGGLSPATYHNVSNTQSPVITISASGANAGFVNLWTVPVWSSDSSFIDYGMTKDVYFWYVMLKKRQKEIYDSQTGSAQPHIYPKHITIMPTIKLNVDEINLYTKRVTPLFKKIANNLYEISKLQLIRETLLPKLMSGEIRVPMDEEGDLS